jgi:hypothetical protein
VHTNSDSKKRNENRRKEKEEREKEGFEEGEMPQYTVQT